MLQNLPKKILTNFSQRLLDPTQVLAELNVQPGWRVLEMGLPVGFFANSLHKLLNAEGSMIIAGPTQESLEILHEEKDHSHTQITTLAVVLAGNAAEKNSLDLILLTNVLSNSAHADNFCLSVAGYLKDSGKLVVIDWDIPPKVALSKENAVTREKAVAMLQQCGFVFERLLNLPGYHFGLVFRTQSD